MWPLSVSQLAEAIAPAARPATGALDADLAPRPLHRAIAWLGPTLGRGDVFFALEQAHYEIVTSALDAGAVCVVSQAWGGLADMSAEHRSRCFVAASPLAAFRRLAAFFRDRIEFPVVAVGGSNGKTTTKEMIAHVLRAGGRRVTATPGTNNGWTGTPITLCHRDHTRPAPDALVLEIGIDEVGAMAEHVALARPDVAVLTALGPEHLAGLGSHEQAIAEELLLFAGSKRRVWLADEPALAARLEEARPGDLIVRARSGETEARAPDGVPTLAWAWRPVSPTEGALTLHWRDETHEARVPMAGAHNGRNAALAIATATMLGRSIEEAARALASLRPPEQRCSVRELPSGCVLVDDTYNASPASVAAAIDVIEAFDRRRERLVILGDMLDLGEEARRLHDALVPVLERLEGAHVRLFGEHMPAIAPRLGRAASIGCAGAAEDPRSLVDVVDLDRFVVLVKGSRGMALERVVAALEAKNARAWDARALGVGVTGPGAGDVARAVRAWVATRVSERPVFVRALDLDDLEQGAAARGYDVAVVSGFRPRDGADVERELAAVAQLLLHLRPGGVGVLAAGNDDSEAMELLAGIVPDHASTRVAGMVDGVTGPAGEPLATLSLVISALERRLKDCC